MAGRFEGVTEDQWKVLNLLIPEEPYIFGRPHPDRRKLLNTILYVLITGCRWCDVPIGPQWGKRSTAHKYLGIWEANGVLRRLKQSLLEIAELESLIDWSRGSVDGSFSPWKGRRG
jgi:transposase